MPTREVLDDHEIANKTLGFIETRLKAMNCPIESRFTNGGAVLGHERNTLHIGGDTENGLLISVQKMDSGLVVNICEEQDHSEIYTTSIDDFSINRLLEALWN